MFGKLSVICLWRVTSWVFSIFELFTLPLQKSCQGYLCRRPTSPPAQRPSNACPILTSFVLPTGLWFSTRPGKSNYTGVREVDFPIIDSMLRMRADDNTHITPLLPPLPLSSASYFVSISLCPSFYFSLSSYLIPLFPKTVFLPLVHFFGSLLLSLSLILIFQSSVTKAGPCHHFRPKVLGQWGCFILNTGFFFNYEIRIM